MSKLYKFLLALISITTLNCTSQANMTLGARDREWDNHEENPEINPDYVQKEKIEADGPINWIWIRQQLNGDDLGRLDNMIGIQKRIQQEVQQEVLAENIVNNVVNNNNNGNDLQQYLQQYIEKLRANEEFIKNTYDLCIMLLGTLPSGYFEQETVPISHHTRFQFVAVEEPELSRQRNRELVLIGLGRGINPNIHANHQDRSNVLTSSIKQKRLGALEALVDYTLVNPNAENIPDWSYINHDIGLVADIHAGQPRIHRECAEQLARLRHGLPGIWNGLSQELQQIILGSL